MLSLLVGRQDRQVKVNLVLQLDIKQVTITKEMKESRLEYKRHSQPKGLMLSPSDHKQLKRIKQSVLSQLDQGQLH